MLQRKLQSHHIQTYPYQIRCQSNRLAIRSDYHPTLGTLHRFMRRLSFMLLLTVQANLSQRSLQSKRVFTC
ncbi:hypothetical protein HanIR_Chr03g0130811 [Helianthus annuus]|nr:hypothetical protein HanIR_Chr03g0130811 [Helianthus annuus]